MSTQPRIDTIGVKILGSLPKLTHWHPYPDLVQWYTGLYWAPCRAHLQFSVIPICEIRWSSSYSNTWTLPSDPHWQLPCEQNWPPDIDDCGILHLLIQLWCIETTTVHTVPDGFTPPLPMPCAIQKFRPPSHTYQQMMGHFSHTTTWLNI